MSGADRTHCGVAIAVALLAGAAGVVTVATGGTATAAPEAGNPAGLSIGGELDGVAVVSARSAWAVGDNASLSRPRPLIVHWNGIRWRRVASPVPTGSLSDVAAASARDAWAVGETGAGRTLILHWNGRAWRRVPSPSPRAGLGDILSSVTIRSARDVWAVGSAGVSGAAQPLILHWNGTAWRHRASPDIPGGGLAGVAASARSAWAVGGTILTQVIPVLLHWNGRAWRRAPSPLSATGEGLTAVAGRAGSDVWVLGYRGGDVASNEAVAMRWNGTHWTRYPVLARGQIERATFGPAGPAAVGVTWGTAGSVPLIARWSGRAWVHVPSPEPAGGALSGLAFVSARDAWAVGGVAASRITTLILHWNGRSWR